MKAQLESIPAFCLALLFCGISFGQTQAPDPTNENSSSGWHRFGESAQQAPTPSAPELTLPAGTWITVRMDFFQVTTTNPATRSRPRLRSRW
jgi:hypothetical protein